MEPCPSGHLPSHASVVQPPTSLWSEEACPVCTSLDQCHMGQTCVVFLGLEREGKRRGQQAAVLAGDSGLVARRTPIGRSSTLAVSDLETSSSGAKAQTLRCDFEGLRVPRHWPIWAVGPADRDGLPVGPRACTLGPVRFSGSYRIGSTPTIESRSPSECRKDCVGGCGLGLTCPPKASVRPLSGPYSDALPVVYLALLAFAGVRYTNVGACGEPGRHRYQNHERLWGSASLPHGLMARRRRPCTTNEPARRGPAREKHTQPGCRGGRAASAVRL